MYIICLTEVGQGLLAYLVKKQPAAAAATAGIGAAEGGICGLYNQNNNLNELCRAAKLCDISVC